MKFIGAIRLFFVILVLVVFFGPYSIITLPILWLIGKKSEDARYRWARKLSYWGFTLVNFFAGVSTEIIGIENLPKEPCLVVVNHRSFFDSVAFMTKWPVPYANVAKDSFDHKLTFTCWMKYLNCVFINRSNPREGLKSINAAVDLIKRGYTVWIYPEGTRCHTDTVNEFKEGSFKIAEKAGCKIVPAAYTNMDDILEKHFPFLKKTHVKAIFSKPYDTKGLSREELKEVHQKVHDDILENYLKYKD